MGASSGARVFAALQLDNGRDGVVTVLPDRTERYFQYGTAQACGTAILCLPCRMAKTGQGHARGGDPSGGTRQIKEDVHEDH